MADYSALSAEELFVMAQDLVTAACRSQAEAISVFAEIEKRASKQAARADGETVPLADYQMMKRQRDDVVRDNIRISDAIRHCLPRDAGPCTDDLGRPCAGDVACWYGGRNECIRRPR